LARTESRMLRSTRLLAVWLAAPSLALSPSSFAAPMLQEPASDLMSMPDMPSSDTPSSETVDLGARWAGTQPIQGVDIEFDWARSVVTALPRSACAPLAASIHRHAIWFEGPQESFEKDASAYLPPSAGAGAYPVSNQQSGQRAFLQRVSTELCARPSQSEDEYTTILHSMLDEARTHINRHVHSAFWVKTNCDTLADACFNTTVLRQATMEALEPKALEAAQDDGVLNYHRGHAGGLSCMEYVLEHEKYNLAEGFTFANISYSLLSRGAAFCTDPSYETTLAEMHTLLEAAMSYHRCNMLFDVMLEDYNKMLCTLPDEYEGQYEEIYAAVAQQIDADVLGATTPLQGESEAPNTCTFDNLTFSGQSFMESNPPSAADLLRIFRDNTNLTVATAIHVADTVLAHEGCVDPRTNATDWRAAQVLREQLHATFAPHMGPDGVAANPFYTAWTGWGVPSSSADFLALPTVYHKLMLMCTLGANATSVCVNGNGNGGDVSTLESNPVFDIVTDTSLASCRGEACRHAAKAVLEYQELLNVITPLRLDTTRISSGSAALPDDPMTLGSWTLQRSCPALRNVVTNAATVQAQLPAVMSGLYAAEPHLQGACVGGMRFLDSTTEWGGTATRILGSAKSKENADKWQAFSERMVAQCHATSRSSHR